MSRKRTVTAYMTSDGYLDGQLLIAMPSMTDQRFHRAVIYICAHSAEGAMGLIINHRAPHITLPRLLEQLEITAASSRPVAIRVGSMAVHLGGPVETSRGFVLHSSDYFAADSTLPIDESVCLTATIDILKAIATGERSRQGHIGARICWMGAGSARAGNSSQWLAELSRRF